MIKKINDTPCLFSNLSDMPDQSYPFYQLAGRIDWGKFETAFQPLYCQDNGRPGKPIRLMCGLPILKHLRNLSDGSLAGQWSENACYQYFCGMREECHLPTNAKLHEKIVEKVPGMVKKLSLPCVKATPLH